MRAVIQRALDASVHVAGEEITSRTGPGLVVLVGVTPGDTDFDAEYVARKVADLRILRDEQSAADAAAWVIVVSQFTLYADVRKGRRPTWNKAAPGEIAAPLVDEVAARLRDRGLDVSQGVFGADMQVSLVNDGPVTILIESPGDRAAER